MQQVIKNLKTLQSILGKPLAADLLRLRLPACRNLPAWIAVRDRAPASLLGEGDDLLLYAVTRDGSKPPELLSAEHSDRVCATVGSRTLGMQPEAGQYLAVIHVQGDGPRRRWTASLAFCAGDAPKPTALPDAPVRGI